MNSGKLKRKDMAMSDEEFDDALAERFRAYESRVRLPDEFKSRFVASLRRKRAGRQFWTVGLICATAVASALIVNIGRNNNIHKEPRPALIASSSTTNKTAEVSCWMLLGYLKECFSRTRASRRKEEE